MPPESAPMTDHDIARASHRATHPDEYTRADLAEYLKKCVAEIRRLRDAVPAAPAKPKRRKK